MYSYYVETEKQSIKDYRFEYFIRNQCESGIAAARHLHPVVEIIYIEEGGCTVEIDGIKHTAEQGDLVLFRAHILHAIYCEEKCVYHCLKLHPKTIIDFLNCPAENFSMYFLRQCGDSLSVFKNIPDFKQYFEKIRATIKKNNPTSFIYARSVAASLLSEILYHDNIKKVPTEEVRTDIIKSIYNVVLYMDKNFAENITATECAKRISVSYSLFSKKFKTVTGKTFKEYLIHLRISHAKTMLLTSDKSISSIAADCGYNHISHFIKEFKSNTGLSPLQYRKNGQL